MKLVQKKCPSCGANLSFDENAKEVTCEYCKQKLIIEREENSSFDDVEFRFRVAKYYEDKSKNNSKKFSCIWIIFLVIGAIILFFVTNCEDIMKDLKKELGDNTSSNITTKKDTYVTEFSQIDKKSLELFHEETLKKIESERVNVPSDTKEGNWEYVGMYLLNSKEETVVDYNFLYDVYKKQYLINGTTLETYAGVRYTDLKLSDDGIVLTTFRGNGVNSMRFLPNTTSYFVIGYENTEEFYNKVLRGKLGDYTIKSTEGMYVEVGR